MIVFQPKHETLNNETIIKRFGFSVWYINPRWLINAKAITMENSSDTI